MKRLVEEFIKLVENPPAPPDTVQEIARKKEKYEELKDSLLKVSSNFFTVEQLNTMKQEIVDEYDEIRMALRTGRKLKSVLEAMYPGSDAQIVNMDEGKMQEKIDFLHGYIVQICAIITTIEIAETLGLIKEA